MDGSDPMARCGVEGRADGSELLGVEWKLESDRCTMLYNNVYVCKYTSLTA